MSEVIVTPRVYQRNSIGQFARECEFAAGETIADLIKQGEAMSKAMAPRGHKPDPRTPTLREGMFRRQVSRTVGYWGCSARHALAIELSAGPHPITGWVHFFWEGAPGGARYWTPGPNMIQHPGNAAQPYLRPAYAVISGKAMAIARSHYPG